MKNTVFDFSKTLDRLFDRVLGVRKIPRMAQLIFLATILSVIIVLASQASLVALIVAVKTFTP